MIFETIHGILDKYIEISLVKSISSSETFLPDADNDFDNETPHTRK